MHDLLIRDIEDELAMTISPAERSRFTQEYLTQKIKKEALQIASQLIVTAPLGPMKSSDATIVDYGISLNAISLKYRKVANLLPKVNACEFEKLGEWYCKQTSLARVIILDDFIGSGSQFEKIVRKIVENQNLLTAHNNRRQMPDLKIYILICVAFNQGVQRALKFVESVPKWLKIKLICGKILDDQDRAFRAESSIFPDDVVRSEAEKLIIELVGKKIYSVAPRGFDNLESIVVFEHNIPNDSLPILYVNCDRGPLIWHAIFPRLRTSEI